MTDDGVPRSRKPGDTSFSLLRRVRANEPAAWERLVHLYTPLICHWCRRYGLNSEDTADVGQNVFTAVARAIGRFKHDQQGATFRGWLRSITRNKVRDFYRRAQHPRPIGGSEALAKILAVPDEQANELEEGEQTKDRLILLRQAAEMVLSEFEESTRLAFLRVTVEQQSPADVAAELGMTVNAVYLAKSRVRRRLRMEFSELIESL